MRRGRCRGVFWCHGCDDLGRLDEEDPVGHPPVADGQPQALEVRLPHRLVLAGVEEHRRRDQRHGLLLGRALVRLDADEAVAQQGLEADQRQPLLGRGLRSSGLDPDHRAVVGAGHAGTGALGEQPVAQHPRGHAVVAVVDGDLVDQAGCFVVPLGVAGGHELVVDDDRVGGVGDRGVAGLHVEGLELLDRVGALGDPDRRAHHGVQVDEHALAQQLVDLVLTHPVAGREAEQGRGLVGGVVVDVQVGPALTALVQPADEVDEGLPLGLTVVGPEGAEHR